MKKLIILATIVLLVASVGIADTTFEWSGPKQTGTLTYTGLGLVDQVVTGTGSVIVASARVNGDVTLEKGAYLNNDAVGDVNIVFTNATSTLGEVRVKSAAAAAGLADDDTLNIVYEAVDSAGNATDYSKIQTKITDVTTASENAQLIFQTTVNGSLVTDMTIGTPAGGTAEATIVPPLTLTGDLDIDGGDITAPADLLITPAGSEVHINGGLAVGDTTAVGDNNLKVVGTSLLVGAVTLTDDIDIDGGDITCPADLTITPTGGDVIMAATVDATAYTADAAAGLDTKTAGALLLGAATATSVEIADALVNTDIQGPLSILAGIDTAAGVTMTVGSNLASKVEIADTLIETEIQGPLDVHEAASFETTIEVDAGSTVGGPLLKISDAATGANTNWVFELGASIVIGDDGAGTMIETNANTAEYGLRCKINGESYFILLEKE